MTELTFLTPMQFFRLTVCFLIIALPESYCGAVGSGKPWSFRWYFLTLLYFFPNFLAKWFLSRDYAALTTISMLLAYFRFACGLRGWRWIRTTFLFSGFFFLADILCGITLSNFLSDEEAYRAAYMLSPVAYLVNGTAAVYFAFLGFCYSLTVQAKQRVLFREQLFRMIRPLVLVVCVVALFARTMQKTLALPYIERFQASLPEFIVIVLLLFLGGSYALQDIRFLRQAQLNSALLQQKETQDALLNETRAFRHNIANMLYGFQGTLLSDDRTVIEEYYANLISSCAIINNENVISLQRIPSLAVTALLLNKIQAANESKVPFYVFTDDKLIYRGPKDKDMCELLGILVDNALESARASESPLIMVEFHNAGSDMEVIVRNTFGEAAVADEQSDILLSTESTKENHEGIGIETVNAFVKRHEKSLFNIFLHGRFVEASLLFNE